MQKPKIILTIVFQIIFITSFAQLFQPQLDSAVRKYVSELNKNGIDTICIYQKYCIGCFFYIKKGDSICNPKKTFDPTYIIWLDHGITFITKKDACFDYSVTTVSNTPFWKYYFENKNAIKSETLKNPQYTEIVDGNETTRSLEVDHSVHYNI